MVAKPPVSIGLPIASALVLEPRLPVDAELGKSERHAVEQATSSARSVALPLSIRQLRNDQEPLRRRGIDGVA
jgi:hypothetical protein